jgi:hypothetical protein
MYIYTYIHYPRDNHMGTLTGQVHIHVCFCFMPLKQLIVQGHFTSIDARPLGVCKDYHHVHHVCYLVYGLWFMVWGPLRLLPTSQPTKQQAFRAQGLGVRVHSMRALSLFLSFSFSLSLSQEVNTHTHTRATALHTDKHRYTPTQPTGIPASQHLRGHTGLGFRV